MRLPQTFLICIAIWSLGGCGDIVRPKSKELPKIVFISDRNGENGIYTMNVDGSNQIRLSEGGHGPRFSPDGSKIVFYNSSDWDIYIMGEDGGNQKNLTNNAVKELFPKFSPDGSKIVFSADQDFWTGDIIIMNIDGSNKINLTPGELTGYSPSFSPDGSKIIFVTPQPNKSETSAIATMDIDGNNFMYLTGKTDRLVFHRFPQFTPDGENIIFISGFELYRAHKDGSDIRKLSDERDKLDIWKFQISSNGTKIVLQAINSSENISEIHIMDIDGKNEINLTSNTNKDYSPYFSADDSQILFVSYRTGRIEIFIMNSDGSEVTQLTTEGGAQAFFQPQT